MSGNVAIGVAFGVLVGICSALLGAPQEWQMIIGGCVAGSVTSLLGWVQS